MTSDGTPLEIKWTSDGCPLHGWSLEGQKAKGPTLVWVPGKFSTAHQFLATGLPQRLCQRFPVLLLDRPGCGAGELRRPPARPLDVFAQAERLSSWLRHLDVEAPVLVGHSFGASVVLAMAAQPLAEIHGLILLAPLAFSTGVLRRAASVLQIPLLGRWAPRVVDWLAGPWMGGVRRRAFAPQEPPPRAGPSELQELKRGLVTELMDLAVLAPSLQRLQAGYGHLSLPVRVIAGAADRILPADLQARRLAARLPRGTLEVVPGGGHMVQFYAQEAIVAAVEELVAVQPRSRDTR